MYMQGSGMNKIVGDFIHLTKLRKRVLFKSTDLFLALSLLTYGLPMYTIIHKWFIDTGVELVYLTVAS